MYFSRVTESVSDYLVYLDSVVSFRFKDHRETVGSSSRRNENET